MKSAYDEDKEDTSKTSPRSRYRLLAQAVIDGVLREKGEEVEYDGEPGPHMELIKGEAPPEAKKPPLDPDYPSEVPGTGGRRK